MFSSDDDNTAPGVVWAILFAVIAALIGLVIGLGIYKTHMPQPAAVAVVEVVEVDGASVKVVDGVVKFYFASAKADIATGANEALAEVVKAVATGKAVRISGFHDATGDQAKNEELSKLRAFAVRDTLAALGVAADKMELVKPALMTGSGSNAEARRVEVTVVQ
jgi:outer membrane protein OmpA-like peptidoglycan-associated protein